VRPAAKTATFAATAMKERRTAGTRRGGACPTVFGEFDDTSSVHLVGSRLRSKKATSDPTAPHGGDQLSAGATGVPHHHAHGPGIESPPEIT
jgi:hypothetical protein